VIPLDIKESQTPATKGLISKGKVISLEVLFLPVVQTQGRYYEAKVRKSVPVH
jgi:hypothetical protein